MGEPNTGNRYCLQSRRTRGELKYLSSHGKEIKRDSLSSDERNGRSPNHKIRIGSFCIYGVWSNSREANRPDRGNDYKENNLGKLTKEG